MSPMSSYIRFLLITFLLFSIAVTLGIFSIGVGLNKRCNMATSYYGKDCISSLHMYLFRKDVEREDRISTLWALGQLGDRSSIHRITTFKSLNDEDAEITYESDKALKWCSTDKNVLSPLWRKIFL